VAACRFTSNLYKTNDIKMLTVGSLFSGIGGLDLGLERAGMKVIWQSEIDPYCNKVLKKHWPEVPNHGNIKDIDWGTVERPNIICGGYPCQPFSTAGKRRGTDDPRHLWPWVRTAISELQPDYAILENVRGHLSMGGLQVIGEIAEIGYDAEWRVVSAAGMGAPHRRDRIIIVAYPNGAPRQQQFEGQIQEPNARRRGTNVANASKQQFNGRGHQHSTSEIKEREALQKQVNRGDSQVPNNVGKRNGQYGFTTDIRTPSAIWRVDDRGEKGYDGGAWWEVEPDVGRVVDGVPHRLDRLRGLGNAVVPQVAEYIGRLVMAAHNNT
jgi:DNA (cytosine-5)-methyltransferase 1